MKKLIILFAAILLGAATSFAQDPILYVTWNDQNCYCLPNAAVDYFKVTYSIYDNANSTWVIPNTTVETDDTADEFLYIPVSEMLDYCHDSHPNTPSFTVTATVWYMLGTPDPDEECCTGSRSLSADCRDFETGDQFDIPVGNLN